MTDYIRLSKLMSQLGLCSRREADDFITQGWVLVDGKPVQTLGTKVQVIQHIALTEQAKNKLKQLDTVIINKPIGYVSGQAEKQYQPAVVLVIPENQLKSNQKNHPFTPKTLRGLAPAGRLDIDSQGLLVLTQDGRIAKQLIGTESSVEKEYVVTIKGEITEAKLAKLGFGMSLDGKKLKPIQVKRSGPYTLNLILHEGRKRQIRRMCQQVELNVVMLKRIRIGRIKLDKLPSGQWRYLSPHEHF